MKTKLILLTVAAMLLSGTRLHAQTSGKKILVAYFSHSGNTRAVAYDICKKVDGEFFEIQTVKPYSIDYNTVVDIAKRELKADFRPELKSKLKNSGQYDVIFVGYPNWWGTYPQAVKVFLSTMIFREKRLFRFVRTKVVNSDVV
jgi:flavodoxin